MIELPKELQDKLVKIPQHGQGYHTVIIVFANQTTLPAYIIDCKWVACESISSNIVDIILPNGY
ncbi:MAG: hypothetical protein HC836_25660 [Richelia sp. RM2_1_2]|nr:hypothetical protein [Richelia sp. RM2_1_2]